MAHHLSQLLVIHRPVTLRIRHCPAQYKTSMHGKPAGDSLTSHLHRQGSPCPPCHHYLMASWSAMVEFPRPFFAQKPQQMDTTIRANVHILQFSVFCNRRHYGPFSNTTLYIAGSHVFQKYFKEETTPCVQGSCIILLTPCIHPPYVVASAG